MRSFLARHPELLLSVSPLLDGYLTVAAGFLIAHVFLSASSFLTFVFAGGFMAVTFLGSLLIGRFADQYGQPFFCRTLLVVPALAAGAACFTDNLIVVTMFQCLIGLFIGADQPVSQAIVTELSSPENRSKRLSFLMLTWYVGALTAVAAEFLLLTASTIEAGSWHMFYVLPACLCLLSLPLRHRLMQEFHPVKVPATVKTVPSLKPYRKALLFCCSFWTCQTLPVTAVMFYSPVILESVTGNPNPLLQIALIYIGFLAGTLPMLKFGDLLPARWVLVGTFAAMAAGLGGHCLRSVCRCAWRVFRTLCPYVWDAVDVGLFAAQSAFSNRCTCNGGRRGVGGVACCVGGGSCGIPDIIEVLQYFRDFLRWIRCFDPRCYCVTGSVYTHSPAHLGKYNTPLYG